MGYKFGSNEIYILFNNRWNINWYSILYKIYLSNIFQTGR